jgi:endonuclease YncB( thermonuclease family)
MRRMRHVITALSAFAVLAGLHTVTAPTADAAVVRRLAYAVDGDTVRLPSDTYVRFIGIDTPEVGQRCAARAERVVVRLTNGGRKARLSNPRSVDDRDGYGRLLRYVDSPGGRDIGAVLIRKGLADARYDGRDGYDRHPRQAKYRRLDRRNPDAKC